MNCRTSLATTIYIIARHNGGSQRVPPNSTPQNRANVDRNTTTTHPSGSQTTSTRSTKGLSKKKEDPGTCICNSKKGGTVIQCEGCQRWCHPSCVCLSTELVRALESVANYYCPVCVLKKVAAPQPASASVAQDDERADIAKLIAELDTMKAEIRDLKKSLKAINEQLKDNPKGSHAGSPPDAGDTPFQRRSK